MKRSSFKYNSQEAGNTPTDGSTSGFPSPAADYYTSGVDLNKVLVQHPSSVVFAWLNDGERRFLAIADRALQMEDGCKLIAWDDNQWFLKKLKMIGEESWLYSIRGDAKPLKVNLDEPYIILGRVSVLIWVNP